MSRFSSRSTRLVYSYVPRSLFIFLSFCLSKCLLYYLRQKEFPRLLVDWCHHHMLVECQSPLGVPKSQSLDLLSYHPDPRKYQHTFSSAVLGLHQWPCEGGDSSRDCFWLYFSLLDGGINNSLLLQVRTLERSSHSRAVFPQLNVGSVLSSKRKPKGQWIGFPHVLNSCLWCSDASKMDV